MGTAGETQITEKEIIMQIERNYTNYRKGHPGYAYDVAVISDDGRKLASATWPGVNGAGVSGRWTLAEAKRVHAGPDDHPEVAAILARL